MVEVRKAFGTQQVLDGFSLEVPDGGVTSVIGPSGAGKSTLLKCIIGLVRIDEGEVWVDDERVDGLEGSALYDLRRKVGFVFQFAALFDSMTLAENVAMGLKRIPGLSAAEIDERVDEALGLVDLRGSEGKYPSELSGGMRKRAGVARAVALRPSYLLYDEPTTGLDPLTVTMVNRLILKMRDELDVTSLIITHDMDSARSVSNRIALLHGGRVRWEGDAGELDVAEDPVVRGFVEGRPELMEEAS
jgi:phospholipid/cholesterol/gamma-HCH transport system ATP-binding protein